jgi:hypothetical protein
MHGSRQRAERLRVHIPEGIRYDYILLNNQRDEALSSRVYYSLLDYCTGFGCFLHPSSGVQLKL